MLVLTLMFEVLILIKADAECNTNLFSDSTSVSLRCAQFPKEDSLTEFCWKTFWWKGQAVNPFSSVGSASMCKKKCNCRISVDLNQFRCSNRGGSITWVGDAPLLKTRSSANCGSSSLPKNISTVDANFIINVNPKGRPLDSNPLRGFFDNEKITGLEVYSSLSEMPLVENILETHADDLNYLLLNRAVDFRNETYTKISRLKNLEILYVVYPSYHSEARISYFLNEASFTSSLTVFAFTGVPLLIFPPWFSNCSKLQVFQLISPDINLDVSSFPQFPHLEAFTLTSFKMKNLSLLFSNISRLLMFIDLSNNMIESIEPTAFSNLNYLKYVDLSSSKIITLPFKDVMISLTLLYLNNGLQNLTIDKGFFKKTPNLNELSISNYANISFSNDAFDFLKLLDTLYINNDSLQTVPIAVLKLCNLKNLNMNNNLMSTPDAIPYTLPLNLKKVQLFLFTQNYFIKVPPAIYFFQLQSFKLKEYLMYSFLRQNSKAVIANNCERYNMVLANFLDPEVYDYYYGSYLIDKKLCEATYINVTKMAAAQYQSSDTTICSPLSSNSYFIFVCLETRMLIITGLFFIISHQDFYI